MHSDEYDQVKDLSYPEYCEYLQKKYGIGRADYMTKFWIKNQNATRLKEGLVVHHRYDDRAVLLSHSDRARNFPFEWQAAKNLVYCDLLEHLFLHILICEMSPEVTDGGERVGYGSIVNSLALELNDGYSGISNKNKLKRKCFDKVKGDRDLYLVLLKRFVDKERKNDPSFSAEVLCKSAEAKFKDAPSEKTAEIFEDIRKLFEEDE